MRLPAFLYKWLHRYMMQRTWYNRLPDMVIGDRNHPYLQRWYIIPRNRFLNIYLHIFSRSDDDRAMHDHPWWNVSILLRGSYKEHTPKGVFIRMEGDVAFRKGESLHRIELFGWQPNIPSPVVTLFITGPRYRQWGFQCGEKWVHWEDFCDPESPGQKGAGCDGPGSIPGTKTKKLRDASFS